VLLISTKNISLYFVDSTMQKKCGYHTEMFSVAVVTKNVEFEGVVMFCVNSCLVVL